MLADASAGLSAAYITGSVAALAIVASLVTTWLTLRYQPGEVASRLLAYGSEEVNRALQRVREARSQSTEAFSETIDAMIAQVRLELQGKKDRERLNSATRWHNQ